MQLAPNVASIQDINIAETLLTAVMLWNEFVIAEIKGLWLSPIDIQGAGFTSESSVFSVMTGWIAEVLFFAYTAVYIMDRTYIAVWEVYWFMGISIINPWGACASHFSGMCKLNNHNYMFSKKSKQTSIRKILYNLKSIGII